MDNSTKKNYPGSALLEYVKHFSGSREQDITNLVAEINVHSDVNISATFADMTIVDKNNWLEKLDLNAGDVVSFSVKHGDFGSYEYRFKIKFINSIVNLESALTYTLRLTSVLDYDSLSLKISKAYSGKPSEIASTILKDLTPEGVSHVEQSSQNISFISPGWSPLEILDYLARQSSTTNGLDRMRCFQNSRQLWFFSSLSGMKSVQKRDILTYRYYANADFKETGKQAMTIKDLTYYRSFSIGKEIERGSVKNTFLDIDPNSKTAAIKTNDYWGTYSKSGLNPKQIWKKEQLGQGKWVYRVRPSNSTDWGYMPDDQSDKDFEFNKTQQIEITVYGNPLVDLGDILNIEIPSLEPANDSKIVPLDNIWSGLYYVIAKRDVITQEGHMMALRLAKDSFRSDR